MPAKYHTAGQNEKIISINDRILTVEIADEPIEQVQGLSDRENLGSQKGMLFIFDQPIMPGFWMKDMHFDIDIIWIDASGTIVGIEKSVSPDTYPQTFNPPSPIKYVLEVNAGWSDKNKIKIGDQITGL